MKRKRVRNLRWFEENTKESRKDCKRNWIMILSFMIFHIFFMAVSISISNTFKDRIQWLRYPHTFYGVTVFLLLLLFQLLPIVINIRSHKNKNPFKKDFIIFFSVACVWLTIKVLKNIKSNKKLRTT